VRGVWGDDVVTHPTNDFPGRAGEEFVAFLRAATASGAGRPEALGAFLAAHPHAKRFVDTPTPIPTSFAREAFFAVTAFTFTNGDGVSRRGRFRIRPDAGTAYLSDEDAAATSADFLFAGLGPRLAREPVTLGVFVQMAASGDDGADASVTWPETRPELPFGTITLTARGDEQMPDLRSIIFDPVPRVDGLESSDDPLTSPEDQEWTGHLSDDILGHKCMIAAQIAAPAEHNKVGSIVTGGVDDFLCRVPHRERQTQPLQVLWRVHVTGALEELMSPGRPLVVGLILIPWGRDRARLHGGRNAGGSHMQHEQLRIGATGQFQRRAQGGGRRRGAVMRQQHASQVPGPLILRRRHQHDGAACQLQHVSGHAAQLAHRLLLARIWTHHDVRACLRLGQTYDAGGCIAAGLLHDCPPHIIRSQPQLRQELPRGQGGLADVDQIQRRVCQLGQCPGDR
jgi:Catalase